MNTNITFTKKYVFKEYELQTLEELVTTFVNDIDAYEEYESGRLFEFIKEETAIYELAKDVSTKYWSSNRYKGFILMLMSLYDVGLNYKEEHYINISDYISKLISQYPKYNKSLLDEQILIKQLENENKLEYIPKIEKLFKLDSKEVIRDVLINIFNEQEFFLNKNTYSSLINYSNTLFNEEGDAVVTKIDSVIAFLNLYGFSIKKKDDDFLNACEVSKAINGTPCISINNVKFTCFESLLIYICNNYERKEYSKEIAKFNKKGNLLKYYQTTGNDRKIIMFLEKLMKITKAQALYEILYFYSEENIKYFITDKLFALDAQDIIDYLTIASNLENESRRIYNDKLFTKWLDFKGYNIKKK